MRHIMLAILAVGTLSSAGLAQQPDPSGAAERGRALFERHGCSACHGTYGQGGTRDAGPKLFPNPPPIEAFRVYLRTPPKDMPPYSEKQVSERDLADIFSYISSLKPMPAAKDIPLLNQF
jgi:ubiquinol-cytochrome c reductase cytochrome c subunit